jgi:hypothetical protein
MPDNKALKNCFVVGPIDDEGSAIRGHADWLLDKIIEPVFAEHFKDFDMVRSDKIAQPRMIDSQVINHLLERACCFGSGQAAGITGIFRRPCKIHSALNCFSDSSDNIPHSREAAERVR